MPSTSKRAVIYCRVSTQRQEDDGTSLETQEMECRKYCAAQGYTVVLLLTEAHTGMHLEERQELSKARDMLRKGRADVLVVWRLDRLSRDQRHQTYITYELSKYKGTVESATEPLDDSPIGRHIRQTYGLIAEMEHEAILKRTQAGIRRRAEAGKIHSTGRPLYGYMYNDDASAYVPNPLTAPIVRRIFQLAADGTSHRQIARTLQLEGITAPQGGTTWYQGTIRNIIYNSAYYGNFEAFTVKTIPGTQYKQVTGQEYEGRIRVDGERVSLPETACPALVTKELAEKAIANHQPRGRKKTHDIRVLEGFVYCEDDGRKMRVSYAHGDRSACYICCAASNAVATCYNSQGVIRLEKIVWERVSAILTDPQHTLQTYMSKLAARQAEEIHLQEHIADLEEEMQNLIMTARRNAGNPNVTAHLDRDINKTANDIAFAKEREAAVIERQETYQDFMKTLNKILALGKSVMNAGLEATIAEKRTLYGLLGLRVVISNRKHKGDRIDVQVHPENRYYGTSQQKNSNSAIAATR